MKRPHLFAALAATAALVLAGCSTGAADEKEAPDAKSQAEEAAFPVTIEHAFGETTIEKEPKRVVTVGWTDHDHALALGVTPIGATKLTWGGNEQGSSEWFDAALEEAGTEAPVRYSDADGIPDKEIAKLDPDVILATNSGITKKDYKALSEIAPVVAYPEAPWITPWQTSLETVAKALGRTELGKEVAAETQAKIDAAKEEYPQLEGTSLIFGYLTTADLSQIGIYAPEDPRVSLMHDFGMVDAPIVDSAIKKGQFYGQVSSERASELESDVFLTWAESPDDMATFADHALIGQIPAIKSGHAYAEADKPTALSITNPTPLSIPFIIEHFLPEVAKAVDGK